MTTFERRWRDALLSAMIPRLPDGRLPGLAALDLERFWARYQSSAPVLLKIGFRVAVLVLTWLPVLRHGRPFHRLGPDAQDLVLQRAASSHSYVIRQLSNVVKLLACFAYFHEPRIQAAIRTVP